jgi:hypothetical protein
MSGNLFDMINIFITAYILSCFKEVATFFLSRTQVTITAVQVQTAGHDLHQHNQNTQYRTQSRGQLRFLGKQLLSSFDRGFHVNVIDCQNKYRKPFGMTIL